MTPEELAVHRKAIANMTHEEMARMWRFAPSGHLYFDVTEPLHAVFSTRWSDLGGWNARLSKQIGWEK